MIGELRSRKEPALRAAWALRGLLLCCLVALLALCAGPVLARPDDSLDVFSTVPNPTPVPSENEFKPLLQRVLLPTPVPVVAPTPVGVEDEPEARPYLPPPSRPVRATVRVGEERFVLRACFLEKQHSTVVAVDDPRLAELFRLYGAQLRVHPANRTVTCTIAEAGINVVLAEGNPIFRDRQGAEVALEVPMYSAQGGLWLPVAALPFMLEGKLQGTGHLTYQLDPLVTSIEADRLQGGAACLAIGSRVPIKWRAFMLKHPTRYVLNLPNAVLDSTRFREAEKRILNVPELGQVHFDQYSLKPNVVRVVIPLQDNQELRVLSQSTSHRLLVALGTNATQEHAEDFNQQRITSMKVDKTSGAVRITLTGTGPFQYEWHRLKAPDNRFFLDITNSVLAGERQSQKVVDPYVSEINLAQFQAVPSPTVRLLLDMQKPADMKVYPPKDAPNTLVIEARHLVSADEGRGFGATRMPNAKQVVCIDAGHGGSDPGALNAALGIYEKDVTLDVAKRLAKALHDQGWEVVMTRNTDKDVSYAGSSAKEELGARVKVGHDFHADLFISIHCNSAADHGACGTSTHWYKASDRVLASFVQPLVVKAIECPSRGLQHNSFYVLRHFKGPAVLIETAFISNEAEGRKLADPEYRQHLATAIASGLTTYVAHQSGEKTGRLP